MKQVAIAGYAVEGKVNYAYWAQQPDVEITIADQRQIPADELPEGVKTILGPDAFTKLQDFDLVVRTASLPPRNITTNGVIWSATKEFIDKCPAPIIGVTGSKGKGTVASLIASILEADGKKVWLVGNIGISALETLPQVQADDYVVFELSSFQLWDVDHSPQTAVLLFIEAEHLDVHTDMEEYVNAKANITLHQTEQDRLIYLAGNKYVESIAERSVAQKTAFPDEKSAHISNNNFYYDEQLLCSTSTLHLKGEHNKLNTIAAIDAVWPYLREVASVERGISNFHGLPHRLAYVATVNNVEYYDDSIATTPTSAIAGLRAFTQNKVVILGGSYKGSDFSELAKEVLNHNVKALLIGDEAKTIAAAFDEVEFSNYEIIDQPTMSKVVARAHELAQPGDVVLLSPSAASFGLFKDYVDRGNQFVASVQSLPQ